MLLRGIKRYSNLQCQGDDAMEERMEMLIQHRQSLKDQIRQLQEHEAKLDEKIAFYQQKIEHHCSDTP